MHIKLFPLLLLFFFTSYSQKTKTLKLKKYKVHHLEQGLKETSGLCFHENKLYTFNDGGNPNKLYEINPINGNTIQTLHTTIKNNDWEAITSDGQYIYLGDIGNNSGNRKNLVIYQNKLENDSLKTINKTSFEFLNQTDFNTHHLNHNFDIEAMIYLENKLHIFTKEWKSKGTSHYSIAIEGTTQKIRPLEYLKTKFLLTDAYFFKNQLYIIGYTQKGNCFLQIFNKSDDGSLLKESYLKFRLGSVLRIGQIEGIAVNEEGIYISSEGFAKSIFKVAPTLFFIPFSALKE